MRRGKKKEDKRIKKRERRFDRRASRETEEDRVIRAEAGRQDAHPCPFLFGDTEGNRFYSEEDFLFSSPEETYCTNTGQRLIRRRSRRRRQRKEPERRERERKNRTSRNEERMQP